MKSALKIVTEFEGKGHPLGMSISRAEVPKLAAQLRRRLGLSDYELNFTPLSLRRLEIRLLELSQTTDVNSFGEEDIVQLVRELTAYLSEILVLHANGRWETLGSLFGTSIIIEDTIKLEKEAQKRSLHSIAFRPGFTCAGAWDMIAIGKKPILYRDYLDAKRRSIKEKLL